MFDKLNNNVKYLRKKANMTQPYLAQKLGVGKSTLANFESGQINTSLGVLDKLHDIFNVSLDDLVYKDLSSSEE